MADTPSDKREADQKLPKKGGKADKYKWYVIAGLALLAGLVFFFVNRSKANAGTPASPGATQPGVDPQTGVPYAQEYGDYGMGGYGIGAGAGAGGSITGPAGPPGATGPPGSRGKRGERGKRGPGPKPQPHKPYHSVPKR